MHHTYWAEMFSYNTSNHQFRPAIFRFKHDPSYILNLVHGFQSPKSSFFLNRFSNKGRQTYSITLYFVHITAPRYIHESVRYRTEINSSISCLYTQHIIVLDNDSVTKMKNKKYSIDDD